MKYDSVTYYFDTYEEAIAYCHEHNISLDEIYENTNMMTGEINYYIEVKN